MSIDLAANTIDGRKVGARICEFAYALQGGPLTTDDAIRKVFGLSEPEDAANALKQIAFRARVSGVRIVGQRKPGGHYRLG